MKPAASSGGTADGRTPPQFTSSLVWVVCMCSRNSMNRSCSLRCPFLRSTPASEALLARPPKDSGSGDASSSCQCVPELLLELLPTPWMAGS